MSSLITQIKNEHRIGKMKELAVTVGDKMDQKVSRLSTYKLADINILRSLLLKILKKSPKKPSPLDSVEFIHFTDNKIAKFIPIKQKKECNCPCRDTATKCKHWDPITDTEDDCECFGFNDKPRGLFFSTGDKWLKWCEMSGVYTNSADVRYTVKIADPARILIIDQENIDRFVSKYRSTNQVPVFHWERVAQKYDGIWFTQDAMELVRGDKATFKNKMKYLWLGGYDVETLVLWSGKQKLIELENNWACPDNLT